jgi:hypothetical protein
MLFKNGKEKIAKRVLKTTKKTEQEILVDCTTANQMYLWHCTEKDLLTPFYDYKYKVGASIKNHIADIKLIAHQLKKVGRQGSG